MIVLNKFKQLITKSCIFKSSDINSVLKEVSSKKTKISIETDAETETDFEKKTNLTKKLIRADNDTVLII